MGSSQTSISIQAKNIRPGMIMGDALITAVEHFGNKIRIRFAFGHEEYFLNSYLTVSRYDNAGQRILYDPDEYRPERY